LTAAFDAVSTSCALHHVPRAARDGFVVEMVRVVLGRREAAGLLARADAQYCVGALKPDR